jgi:hypothetical protein
VRALLALVLVCTASACALDARDLRLLRETATGPEKLSAVLRDRSRAPALRAQAALMLIDLERSDVNGRALLLDALRRSDGESRKALYPTFERGLLARMETPRGHVPSLRALAAKDLGVQLMSLFEPESAERLGIALLAWLGDDVERRADAGKFSLEAVAAKLGQASALPSAESVRPELAAKSLTRLADTIERHADPRMRALAAAKIVEVERAYRARPDSAADLREHALPALGRFADNEVARARLVAIATDRTLPNEQRAQAFDLLAHRAQRQDLEALASVLLDPAQPLALRELSLARVIELGASESLPSLSQLIAERERTLREPAAVATVALGGERAVATLLRTLPNHWGVRYAKSELDAYTQAIEQLPPTGYLVALLGSRLYSPHFFCRVLALRYLAHRAHPLDATWRLRLHVGDTLEVLGEGFPPRWTVGREATQLLRELATR